LTQEKHDADKHSDMNVLGDFCYITKGMVLNADETKAHGEFVKSALISSTQDDIHCKKYIEGKDIEKYSIKRIRFLEWGTKRCPYELSRPTFPELYTNRKLLINALGEIKASIDLGKDLYCEQQVRMALLWKDLSDISNKSITSSIKKFSSLKRKEMEELSEKVDLRYLLGVINSRYASVLLSNIRGGDYHIVPEYIRNIPIPLADIDAQKAIITVVDTILELKQKDPSADISKEEQEIDYLVYKLYGLTYDEVKVVDSGTPITKEEYEKTI
jgi:adenine-specific DNA-methyltransferase